MHNTISCRGQIDITHNIHLTFKQKLRGKHVAQPSPELSDKNVFKLEKATAQH